MLKKLFNKIDIYIILCVTILFTIGLLAIASATKAYTGEHSFVKMQIIAFMLSIIAFLCALNFDYAIYKNLAPCLYVLLIIPLFLLITIPSIGHSTYGATRWFKIGPMLIQFSEFAKIIFILTFAAHINKIQENDKDDINKPLNLIALLLHAAIPIAFIMKQPDNGTALVFCVIAAAMLFIADLDKKYIITVLGVGILMLPIFYYFILPNLPQYVRNRILVFLDPSLDPLGAGYNMMMAILSIGSGMIWGQGLFKGIQVQSNTLPVKESDFIFSVIGQEMGFVGCVFIIIIYILLFARLLYLAKRAKDNYGTLIIIGVSAMLFFHMLQSIGMNIGLMPVTGIPLPFISYGGSSLLANMIGIGLALNAGKQSKMLSFDKAKKIDNIKR